MHSPTILVLTTVHHPDDPRIREKLVRAVASEAEVLFATRDPGPSDDAGLTWIPLSGSRLRRNWMAWRVALGEKYDVLSLHDPEGLPLGLAVALVKRRRVVFDVHEDIPAQILTKRWIPPVLRSLLSLLSRVFLWLAETTHEVTLAEPGYQSLFRKPHHVFPNYLPEFMPDVRNRRLGYAVYVGDVTEERGLVDATVAAARAGIDLRVVGRVETELRSSLLMTSSNEGGSVEMTGWLPHSEALDVVSEAAVGVSPLHDLPNYRNSLPTKVLEYLALGVPVVATSLPGTRAALDGLEAVELVPAGDVEAMTSAISRAVDLVEVAIRQAASVRTRFRWPAEEVRSFYLSP